MAAKDRRGAYGKCAPGRSMEAKNNVRFVFITGSEDFRYHYVTDIYNGGYKANGFKALLIDAPEMKHSNCNAESLSKALEFIEAKHL